LQAVSHLIDSPDRYVFQYGLVPDNSDLILPRRSRGFGLCAVRGGYAGSRLGVAYGIVSFVPER
jgi:hypothetical protein